MSRKTVGMLGMILGGLVLSLELYLLQFVHRPRGMWYEEIVWYMGHFPCNWALVITVFIVIVSGAITFYQKK